MPRSECLYAVVFATQPLDILETPGPMVQTMGGRPVQPGATSVRFMNAKAFPARSPSPLLLQLELASVFVPLPNSAAQDPSNDKQGQVVAPASSEGVALTLSSSE